jgi:hypothetical protein
MLNNVIRIRVQETWKNNVIEWKVASYYGGDDDYFISDKDSKVFKSIFKHVLDTKSVISKGDTVYASKASEVPRFKLKEFIKENNLKKTSRFEYANAIIINKGYFQDLNKRLKEDTFLFINKDYAEKEWKNWVGTSEHAINNTNAVMKTNKDLNSTFIIDEYTQRDVSKIFKNHPNELSKFEKNTHEVKGIFINLYREARISDLVSLLYKRQKDIISGDCKVIFDEDLFVELNKEGIELDEEYLQVLRDMLFSEDKSNVKLGFEMMSNLVVTQPMLLSVSFLLNELIHTTGFRPSYYTSSNSNLKSLLKVLKTKGIYWERDWKTFGTGLRLNFKEGNEGAIVKKFLLDNINREFKLNNSAAESLVDIVFATEAQ